MHVCPTLLNADYPRTVTGLTVAATRGWGKGTLCPFLLCETSKYDKNYVRRTRGKGAKKRRVIHTHLSEAHNSFFCFFCFFLFSVILT